MLQITFRYKTFLDLYLEICHTHKNTDILAHLFFFFSTIRQEEYNKLENRAFSHVHIIDTHTSKHTFFLPPVNIINKTYRALIKAQRKTIIKYNKV